MAINKRGLSTLVATVLLILIVVAAVAIVWASVLPLISEINQFSHDCSVAQLSIDTRLGYTCYDSTNKILSVSVSRGSQEYEISKIAIVVSDGMKSMKIAQSENLPGLTETRTFILNVSDLGSVNTVSVAPVIKKGNSEKECGISSTMNSIPICSSLLTLGGNQSQPPDTTPPAIDITLPLNASYSAISLGINITLNEAGNCLYSLNAGATNISMANKSATTWFSITNATFSQGSNTILASCNDTAGNKNSTTRVFNIQTDIMPPTIILKPYTGTYTIISMAVNATMNEAGNCLFSLNAGGANVSMLNTSTTQWNSNGNVTFAQGANTLTLYCNDSVGNKASNSTTVTVVISSTAPIIQFVPPTPADGSSQSGNSIFVNVSSSGSSNISTFIDFDSSLVSWWRMDDVSSGVVVDYMGRNNMIAYGNAAQTVSGYLGKAFNFDGKGDYIKTNKVLNGNKVSYGGWFKINDTTFGADWMSVIMGQDNADYTGTAMWADSYGIYCYDYATGGSYYRISLEKNKWYNVYCVYNSTDSLLYLNGVLKNSVSDAWTPTNDEFVIGGHPSDGHYYFNGTVDDVMVFSRSLSAAEIAGLYANQTSKYLPVNFTSLAAGSHIFKAYAQDLAGNVNYTDMRTVTITAADTTPPAITIIPYTGTYSITSLAVNGTLSEAGNCKYSLNAGGTNVSMLNTSTTQWNSNGNVTFLQGANTPTLYCNDSAGNKASNSTTVTISLPLQYCSDGTLYGSCSVSQPWYCNNGDLINNCASCGCPSSYRYCNADGRCYSIGPYGY